MGLSLLDGLKRLGLWGAFVVGPFPPGTVLVLVVDLLKYLHTYIWGIHYVFLLLDNCFSRVIFVLPWMRCRVSSPLNNLIFGTWFPL